MELKASPMFYFTWWTWLWISNFLLPGPQKSYSHLWQISKEPQSNVKAQETETERGKADFSLPLGSQASDPHTTGGDCHTLSTPGDSACSCPCLKNFFPWLKYVALKMKVGDRTRQGRRLLNSSISRCPAETANDHDPVLLLWNLCSYL